MILNKKGQGLSLNVIIVAAIALIVLVVLVAVFTGRIGTTTEGIDKAAQAEVIKLKISYGKCHPTTVREDTFGLEYSSAESAEDKAGAERLFKDDIKTCKGQSIDKAACESAGCEWD